MKRHDLDTPKDKAVTWNEVAAGFALFFIIYGVVMILAKCLILVAHSVAKRSFHAKFWMEYFLILAGCLLLFAVI